MLWLNNPYNRASLGDVMKNAFLMLLTVSAFSLLIAGYAEAGIVQGTVTYTDKTFDSSGFTGYRYLPIPFARVSLYKKIGTGDDDATFVATSNLSSEGFFSFSYSGSEDELQIRLYSDCTNGIDLVRILDSDSSNFAVYFQGAGLVTDTSGNWTGSAGSLSSPSSLCVSEANYGGAFNIMFCIARAAEEIYSLEGSYPGRATVRWEPGSTTGTYVESISEQMFLLGNESSDTDEYDDTVILHEYGHIISYNYSQEDSPGGYHFGEVSDLRLAWTEAWSGYFASWMYSLIESRTTGAVVLNSTYVDTRVNSATAWSIEPPSASGFPGVHSNDEIAIQSGLWDIYDPANETWDQAFTFSGSTTGEIAIWETYKALANLSGSEQITFEDFWETWFDEGYGNEAAMLSIFTDHLEFSLKQDVFEDNDTHYDAHEIDDEGTTYTNTFYPAEDVDWFSLSAVHGVSYTVSTSDLINGADTKITVYSYNTGSVIATNDNASSYTRASQVTFTLTYDQNVKIKVTQVSSSSYAEFGGYKISAVANDEVPDPSGSGGGGGGCFISTSAFGCYSAQQVVFLCNFRDNSLSSSANGSSLTALYYAVSPSIAEGLPVSSKALLRRFLSARN